MSVYEPDAVHKLLSALEPKDTQKKFEASWKNAVSMQSLYQNQGTDGMTADIGQKTH
jgi:hypothetical protein